MKYSSINYPKQVYLGFVTSPCTILVEQKLKIAQDALAKIQKFDMQRKRTNLTVFLLHCKEGGTRFFGVRAEVLPIVLRPPRCIVRSKAEPG